MAESKRSKANKARAAAERRDAERKARRLGLKSATQLPEKKKHLASYEK